MATESLVARAHRLRADVARHKAAMRRHRDQLQTAAADLAQAEAECRRRGVSLVFVSRSTPGEGDVHGHHPERARA